MVTLRHAIFVTHKDKYTKGFQLYNLIVFLRLLINDSYIQSSVNAKGLILSRYLRYFTAIFLSNLENKIFLISTEIQMGSVAKLYMRKGFLIYKEMRKYLVIYEEAISHI